MAGPHKPYLLGSLDSLTMVRSTTKTSVSQPAALQPSPGKLLLAAMPAPSLAPIHAPLPKLYSGSHATPEQALMASINPMNFFGMMVAIRLPQSGCHYEGALAMGMPYWLLPRQLLACHGSVLWRGVHSPW